MMFRAALGVEKLDASTYARIQTIGLEAPPGLGVLGGGKRFFGTETGRSL